MSADKLVLEVPAMHCGGCLETIKRHLTSEAGIKQVDGDTQNKQVCVTYRPETVTPDHIKTVIARSGFRAAG